MPAASPTSAAHAPGDAARHQAPLLLPFFCAIFLYLWLVVDPSLLYECTASFPAFLRGREFAAGFLWYPGGPAEYLAALLYQIHYFAWAGALVMTALAGLLCWATRLIFGALAGPGAGRWVALIPPLLVVALSCQYSLNLAALLAVTAAVLVAGGYMSARGRGLRPVWAALLYAGAGVALCYTVAGPLLIFAVLCAIYELRRGSLRLVGLLYLLAAEIAPAVVGVRWLDVPAERAWFALLPLGEGVEPQGLGTLAVLCVYFPVVACSVALWPSCAPRLQGLRVWLGGQTARLGALSGRPATGWAGPLAVLLAVGSVASCGPMKNYVRTQRCFSRGDWKGVLREAAEIPAPEVVLSVCHQVNAALYHEGRLLDEMFAYPQSVHGLMLGTAAQGDALPQAVAAARLAFYFQLGDLDLQLGLVNEAEHAAYEALVTFGPHPTVLKRLAQTCCIKGQPEAARVILNTLSGDIIWRSYALEAAAELDRSVPRVMQDVVQRVRPVMLREDAYTGMDFDKLCRALLRGNPRNCMAIEYLMAYHLLRRDTGWCVANLGLLKAAGYDRLPRHVQEAIVLHDALSGTHTDLKGYEVATDTYTRFLKFSRVMRAAQAHGGALQASPQVVPEYGNSYFYYYVFQQSGVGSR